MYTFTSKNLSDLVYKDLAEKYINQSITVQDVDELTVEQMNSSEVRTLATIESTVGEPIEVSLAQPTTESVFPCRVIETPLENVNKSDNAIPILKTFQISIEHWDNKQRFCMEMASNTDRILQDRNFIRTNSSPIFYDEITKKYCFITTYEVRWNALTNAFHYIR